jgi:hypothetical protein
MTSGPRPAPALANAFSNAFSMALTARYSVRRRRAARIVSSVADAPATEAAVAPAAVVCWSRGAAAGADRKRRDRRRSIRDQRSAARRPRKWRSPCFDVEAHQNKFGDVPAAAPFRLHSLLRLPVAPRGPKHGCGFLLRQPALARRTLFRQDDCDHLRAQSFTTAMVDGGAQVLKLASRGGISGSPCDKSQAQFAVDAETFLSPRNSSSLPIRPAVSYGRFWRSAFVVPSGLRHSKDSAKSSRWASYHPAYRTDARRFLGREVGYV